MNVQVTACGQLAYDSRLPAEKGYAMESIRICDTVNKGGSATLILPPQHPLRDGFPAFRTEVVIYRDGKLRWRGRPLPRSRGSYNQSTIVCEGELCFLQDATLRPCSIAGDLTTIFTAIINAYNATVEDWKRFAVGSVTVSVEEEVAFSSKTAQLAFTAVQNLIKTYGGYIIFDSLPDGTRRINWYAELPYTCNQRIKWGYNLTDFSAQSDVSGFATRIVPYGAMDQDGNRLTIDIDGKDYVENAEAVAQRGVIEVPKTYTDISDPEELRAAAQRDVDRAGVLPETIQLSALDLSRQDTSLESFCVGQRVNADSGPHNLSGVYDLVSIEEDLVDSSIGKITLTREAAYLDGAGGTLTGSLSTAEKKDQTERQFISYLNAVAGLTATLLGANGGCVRLLDTDGDGVQDTLYIADNPDPAQAVTVWRFNYEGWGASQNGYNGPFTMGATLKDGFVADFISAGTLLADLIKTGILQSKDGKTFYLDLDNGILKAVFTELSIQGKSVADIAKESVDVGGTNLLVNSEPTAKISPWAGANSTTVSYEAFDGRNCIKMDPSTSTYDSGHVCQTRGDTIAGETYTLSGYVYAENDRTVSLSAWYPGESGWVGLASKSFACSAGWNKLSLTFSANADIGSVISGFGASKADGVLYIWHPQLEQGNIATDWSPAPEDLAQTQESVFNALTNNGAVQGFYVKDGTLYINAGLVKILSLIAEKLKSISGNLELRIDGASITMLQDGNALFTVETQYDGYPVVTLVRMDDGQPYSHTTLCGDGVYLTDVSGDVPREVGGLKVADGMSELDIDNVAPSGNGNCNWEYISSIGKYVLVKQ